MASFSRLWLRLRKFVGQKVLHTDDTPHAIALGTALAVFVAFLPLVGIQMVVAIGLAALFRANKAVCVPVVWITNPVTMGPIYFGCYEVGRLVVPTAWLGDEPGLARLIENARTASLLDPTFWRDALWAFAGAGIDLWIGCAIVGAVASVAGYFVSRAGVIAYRERRRQRMLRRTLFRASKLAGKGDSRPREPA